MKSLEKIRKDSGLAAEPLPSSSWVPPPGGPRGDRRLFVGAQIRRSLPEVGCCLLGAVTDSDNKVCLDNIQDA